MTGKDEYEFGDLSIELDTRIKKTVADFCGKDEYMPGDLSREIGSRVAVGVKEFTGKEYEFGDVSKEIERRRVRWVKEVIGKEDYQFVSGRMGLDSWGAWGAHVVHSHWQGGLPIREVDAWGAF